MSSHSLRADCTKEGGVHVRYHPLFAFPDGDAVLQASDATCFRLHSPILKNSLKFFDTLFSLPQPTQPTGAISLTDPSAIVLSESANVLERLLTLAFHMPILPWSSYEQIEAVALAAEKYQGQAILDGMRNLITSPFAIQSDGAAPDGEPMTPLQTYQIAAHFGWEREARWASTKLLYTSVLTTECQSILDKIPSAYLVRLFRLQDLRRMGLQEALDSDSFEPGNHIPHICKSCTVEDPDDTWHILKTAFSKARQSSEDTSTLLLETMPEAIRCWEARCSACAERRFSKDETMLNIIRLVEGLPISI